MGTTAGRQDYVQCGGSWRGTNLFPYQDALLSPTLRLLQF